MSDSKDERKKSVKRKAGDQTVADAGAPAAEKKIVLEKRYHEWIDPLPTDMKVASLGLTDKNCDVLKRYCRLSGRIRSFHYCINNFLIDEFHRKRGKQTRSGKYKLLVPALGPYYYKVLFQGKKTGIWSYDVFPSSFKSELEECLFDEWTGSRPSGNNFDLIDVFYGERMLDVTRSNIAFDPKQWSLSTTPDNIQHANDVAIFVRFRNELLQLMKDAAETVRSVRGEDKANPLIAECKRFEKVTKFCE